MQEPSPTRPVLPDALPSVIGLAGTATSTPPTPPLHEHLGPHRMFLSTLPHTQLHTWADFPISLFHLSGLWLPLQQNQNNRFTQNTVGLDQKVSLSNMFILCFSPLPLATTWENPWRGKLTFLGNRQRHAENLLQLSSIPGIHLVRT